MDAFEKAINDQVEQDSYKYAVDVLNEHLMKDKSEGSYYCSWQSNIAKVFKDECNKVPILKVHGSLVHEIANNAAKKFLDLLIHAHEKESE